jgi:hypothetical protein
MEMIESDAFAFKKSGSIKTATYKNCPKYGYRFLIFNFFQQVKFFNPGHVDNG